MFIQQEKNKFCLNYLRKRVQSERSVSFFSAYSELNCITPPSENCCRMKHIERGPPLLLPDTRLTLLLFLFYDFKFFVGWLLLLLLFLFLSIFFGFGFGVCVCVSVCSFASFLLQSNGCLAQQRFGQMGLHIFIRV